MEKGGSYLREELKTKGLISSDDQLMDLKSQLRMASSSLDITSIPSNW